MLQQASSTEIHATLCSGTSSRRIRPPTPNFPRGSGKTDALANQQPHEIYINESGLYSLTWNSKRPEAKAFRHWITSEVLPSIREHGSYGGPGLASLAEQMQGLQGTIAALTQRLDTQPRSQVQHKVLSIATPQGPQAEKALLAHGTVLTSEQVEDLNASSGVITISEWLHLHIDAGEQLPQDRLHICKGIEEGEVGASRCRRYRRAAAVEPRRPPNCLHDVRRRSDEDRVRRSQCQIRKDHRA